jgi:hypothetical protein
MAIKPPRNGPYHRIASLAYSEHVGRNRHDGTRFSGESQRRYHEMSHRRTFVMA